MPFDEKLGERVAESAARELFEAAVREMDDAALLLQQRQDPGIGTQRIQESILAKLDQVLKAARESSQRNQSRSRSRSQSSPSQNAQSQQQQEQGQQPGGQDPNRGQTAPGSVREVVGQDEGAMRTAGQEWGNLPPRVREELQQGTQEHFSPVYRGLTERYYQRLSQETGP